MIESVDRLAPLLRGTLLEGRAIHQRWPCAAGATVFFLELEPARKEQELALLRALTPQTGRYVLLSRQDYLDLFLLGEAPPASDPAQVRADARYQRPSAQVDLSAGVEHLASGGRYSAFSPTRTNDLFDWLGRDLDEWDHPLGQTLRCFGASPSVQSVRELHAAGVLQTDADLERWLFEWEIAQFGPRALEPTVTWHLDGHEFADGAPAVAVLLPTATPWEAFLRMGWYGLVLEAQDKAAALRVWEQRYGAEVTGSYTTTVHMHVQRRPGSAAEAFDLAIEHLHFAPDTLVLPGVSLRDHARALLSLDRWFFHSRP